jgi:hypothetical protein
MKPAVLGIISTVSKVLFETLYCAFTMALIWDVLEWMHNFGTGIPLIPELDRSQFRSSQSSASGLIGWLGGLIDLYNYSFLGAARFGSALGLFMGGFYSLALIKGRRLSARVSAGIVVGALMGARLALMITSNATFCLFGIIAGSFVVAVSIFAGEKGNKLPTLPPADGLQHEV